MAWLVAAFALLSSEATLADEQVAAEIEAAPLPGDESGRIDHGREPESLARKLGRGLLFVPRTVVEIVFLPIRAGTWAFERYQLAERWRQAFFDDTGTYGLYPTLHYRSSYGITTGARFVHRDLFGERERLSLGAEIGGELQQRYSADLGSGERLGDDVSVWARGEFERRPWERYFGIGNTDGAPEARHGQQLERAATQVDITVAGDLHLGVAGALTDLEYSSGSHDELPSIETVYDPSTLTGFMGGVRHIYGEVELRYDSRRRASIWDPVVLPATGWLALGFAGRVHQLEEGDSYWRTGGEIQRFIPLGRGPRVLAARLYGEAVTGGYRDVALSELPQLGGRTLLRGYPSDRFRDRAAAMASVEYQWDLGRNLSASLFVDAGRVYPSVRDLSVNELRVGYGVGVRAITGSDFIADVSVATSVDGGAFLNLAFDPVFDINPRVVRQ